MPPQLPQAQPAPPVIVMMMPPMGMSQNMPASGLATPTTAAPQQALQNNVILAPPFQQQAQPNPWQSGPNNLFK